MILGHDPVKLPALLAGLPPVHEVIVVDSSLPAIAGIRAIRPTRAGAGNALACGVEAATGDVVVSLPAASDPAGIPRLLDALRSGADVVHGSRYLSRRPALTDLIVLWFLRVLFGCRPTDPGHGVRAFHRADAGRLGLPQVAGLDPVRGDGPEIDPLLAARTVRAGLHGAEVASPGGPGAPLLPLITALVGEWFAERRAARETAPDSIVVMTGRVRAAASPAPSGPHPLTVGPLAAGPLTAGPLTAGPLTAGPLTAGPLAAGPLAAGFRGAGPRAGAGAGRRAGAGAGPRAGADPRAGAGASPRAGADPRAGAGARGGRFPAAGSAAGARLGGHPGAGSAAANEPLRSAANWPAPNQHRAASAAQLNTPGTHLNRPGTPGFVERRRAGAGFTDRRHTERAHSTDRRHTTGAGRSETPFAVNGSAKPQLDPADAVTRRRWRDRSSGETSPTRPNLRVINGEATSPSPRRNNHLRSV
ncbi:hypothetical protein ACTI_04320 [Actinoplanes sp. OR16]|nr:hypothetical protein ACTI_04320 [Actinoplanes sp. OR16]